MGKSILTNVTIGLRLPESVLSEVNMENLSYDEIVYLLELAMQGNESAILHTEHDSTWSYEDEV